jgi:hypothetical protein
MAYLHIAALQVMPLKTEPLVTARDRGRHRLSTTIDKLNPFRKAS